MSIQQTAGNLSGTTTSVPLHERANRHGTFRRRMQSFFWMAAALVASMPSMAAVVVQGTRYIYPAGETEITVSLVNRGKQPALTKAWIDDGRPSVRVEQLKVPFLLTPPLARVEPGQEQHYRLRYTGKAEDLPRDRESLYWINLLEVPPKGSDRKTASDTLQLAFQYRVKLLYRPSGLEGNARDAGRHLIWFPDEAGSRIIVSNPTPYFVSLSSITLAAGERTTQIAAETLSPYSDHALPLPEAAGTLTGNEVVRYQWIDDLGGRAREEKPVSRR